MNLKDFELVINYSFDDQSYLINAIQHKSFNKDINNERLEFLGDSILNSVISEYLFIQFPDYQEGILTRARAKLVKGSTLTLKANQIGLNKIIKLSKGMINLSEDRKYSILEGAFEAVIGAIFIDGGWKNAKKVIYKIYSELFNEISEVELIKNDIKVTCPWFFEIKVEKREELINFLKENGIGSRIMYPALHTQECNSELEYSEVKNSLEISKKGLWIPSMHTLTNEEIKQICLTIKKFFKRG